MITIEYFGPSKDFTSKESEKLDSITTLKDLYNHFVENYSVEFQKYVEENCGITLNYEYIEERNHPEEIQFEQGDEICIIPPVSSG